MFGVVCEALGWAIGLGVLDARGITVVLTKGDVLLLVFGGLAGAAVLLAWAGALAVLGIALTAQRDIN